jgi:pentatricopeptide repeat protein
MMREHHIEPTAFTNNQFIYSVAQRLSGASEKEKTETDQRPSALRRRVRVLELLEEAFAAAERIKRLPSGPGLVDYSHLLYACGSAARLINNRARQSQQGAWFRLDDDAKAEMRDVLSLADQCWASLVLHQPSGATRSDLMIRMQLCLRRDRIADDAADAAEGLRSALEAFDEMQRRGIRPNQDSYGYLVRACARHGDYRRLVQLVEDMRAHGVQPTAEALSDTVLTLTGSSNREAQAALSALRSIAAGQRSV